MNKCPLCGGEVKEFIGFCQCVKCKEMWKESAKFVTIIDKERMKQLRILTGDTLKCVNRF